MNKYSAEVIARIRFGVTPAMAAVPAPNGEEEKKATGIMATESSTRDLIEKFHMLPARQKAFVIPRFQLCLACKTCLRLSLLSLAKLHRMSL